jgi:hypothetical protein
MKIIKLILFCGIVAFFSACQKDNITVTLKTAGSLSAQIIDSSGTTYPKLKVHLLSGVVLSSGSSLSAAEIDEQTTDNNGNVSFGTLEAGTYYIYTDTIKTGNKYYLIGKSFQVISGDSKSLKLNPFEYIGTVKLQVEINANGGVDTINLTTLKVALIKYSDYKYNANRQYVISKAIAIKSPNINGNVEFDNVPANIEYIPYVYINNTDTIGGWSTNGGLSFSKGDIYSGYAYVNLSSLIIQKGNISITYTYYSYTTYTNIPVKSANVVLINYNDYYNYNLSNATQSTILSHKVGNVVITNTSGLASFINIPTSNDYYTYIYNTYGGTWVTSYVYSNANTTNNYQMQITGSYLGLSK